MAGLTINDPTKWNIALNGENIIPGDVLELRAGTYSLDAINLIVGTAENPVTIKAHAGERVVLNGDFKDNTAQYITYIDLEFTTSRVLELPAGANYNYPGTNFSNLGGKVINCTLHDSVGAGAWDKIDLVYGCISYNHGVTVDGNRHGHTLYSQNSDPTHNKTIKHSVFGSSANFGLHGFATSFNLTNYSAVENVLLPFPNVPNSRHLIGSLNTDDGITFQGNHVYGQIQIGYGGDNNLNLAMNENIMYRPDGVPLQINYYKSGTVQSNVIVSGVQGGTQYDVLTVAQPSDTSVLVWDNNAYYSRSGKSACFSDTGLGWKTFAQWQAAYGDANSTVTLDGSSPDDSSHVYPNEYAAVSKRKGLVVIWNWSQAEIVVVDLTTIPIDAGAAMSVINCEDPLVDVVSTTMPENKVYSFPMTGHTVAQVAGWTARPTAFPTMGAFMIEV